ncbi:MAG: hypothetical protein AMJ81_01125 [Phycisphaerae bacterium SM23_33]|jgi:biopolymer transport protein ExbD|nr:MAG: hypothetical protein AMJ81_01125 [Phycisphaerae bacterium SM23_33]
MARATRQLAENGTPHYESERQKRAKQRAPTMIQPPLTPMIDVTFQLLIFFLLACNFRMVEGQIQAKLPDISGPEVAPPFLLEPIRVSLAPAGTEGEGVLIEIGGVRTTRDPLELHAVLKQLRDRYQSDEVPVIIQPAAEVRWAHVVDAFNQAVRARFKNVALAPAET